MKYDFTSHLERYGKDAIAVDRPTDYKGAYAHHKRKEGYDVIPMWVADMNFPTFPGITDAMAERIAHPAFGYFDPKPEYYQAIIQWQKDRNGIIGLKPEHIGYENGVLGGIVSTLGVLASGGDNVLLHSPTYIGFTHAIENSGYHIIHSPLHLDEKGIWRMNYEDMEKKIVENQIHVCVLCNPYNPTGRVWTKEELLKCMEIFEKHHVWIIADEIWSDLMLDGHVHTPVQSVNQYAHDHTAAFYAPSKTFNLAGLIGSYHIIYNDWLRERQAKEASLSCYNSMNVLSMHALIGAYTKEGEEWVDELCQVLSDNARDAVNFIQDHFQGVSVSKPEGTYMLFLDCREFCKKHEMDMDTLLNKGFECGVYWQDGRPFHGEYAIRMNLALPHDRMLEAFQRLKDNVFTD
jgi:cystathionine beta-lyase